jgi:hypothetical protein
MKYANVIFETPTRTIYYLVATDRNVTVKIAQTSETNSQEKIPVSSRYKKHPTYIIVPNLSLLLKKFTLPRMDENNIYNAIKFAMEEYYYGENMTQYTIGYKIVHTDSKNLHIIAWGIKKSVLENLLKKYSDFAVAFIIPNIALLLNILEYTKFSSPCNFLALQIPNEIITISYSEFITNLNIRMLKTMFYKLDGDEINSNNSLCEEISKLAQIMLVDSSIPNIMIYPYTQKVIALLQEKGYSVSPFSFEQKNGVGELLHLPKITEKENLLKEEFKKVEPYYKILSQILFLMVIMLLTIIPLYLVKKKDYLKSKALIDKERTSFVNSYTEVTGKKWEDFQKALKDVQQTLFDYENTLGIAEKFPIQYSALEITQRILSIADMKSIEISRTFIDTLQKKMHNKGNCSYSTTYCKYSQTITIARLFSRNYRSSNY